MKTVFNDRRAIIYGVVFSIASYVTAAILAVGSSVYALGSFLDPIVTLTVPLILISIGLQAMNKRYSIILLALINSLLYYITSPALLFMVPTFLVSGVIDEVISWTIGYRGLRAVMINTTVVGGLIGVLSVFFGSILIGIYGSVPFSSLLLAYVIFGVIYFVESAIMGYISYKIGSYLINSGIMKS
ncbi:hypothetical protein SUSAZ_04000 [Sulfolobus acidocaldarius SUSAZ]|nr:hypothetical protein SUSAZ_04000 [Sulfolobus acidocaldarius SUSAZ]